MTNKLFRCIPVPIENNTAAWFPTNKGSKIVRLNGIVPVSMNK